MNRLLKLSRLLGLAHRARRLTLGSTATLSGLDRGRVHLVIVATDVGRNTETKIRRRAASAGVPFCRVASKNGLGAILGRNELGVVGVTDPSFAGSLKGILEGE